MTTSKASHSDSNNNISLFQHQSKASSSVISRRILLLTTLQTVWQSTSTTHTPLSAYPNLCASFLTTMVIVGTRHGTSSPTPSATPTTPSWQKHLKSGLKTSSKACFPECIKSSKKSTKDSAVNCGMSIPTTGKQSITTQSLVTVKSAWQTFALQLHTPSTASAHCTATF